MQFNEICAKKFVHLNVDYAYYVALNVNKNNPKCYFSFSVAFQKESLKITVTVIKIVILLQNIYFSHFKFVFTIVKIETLYRRGKKKKLLNL